MAALLALHGIATPGILVGMNGVVAFTGGATLPVGAAVLALSALPSVRRVRSVRPLIVLQIVLLSTILALGAVGMLVPSTVPSVPATRSTEAYVLLAVGLILFAVLTLRALRTFLLTRRPADLVVAIGLFWLASALPPAMLLSYMELGWWMGHGFELLGMMIVGVPVALDLRHKAQSRPLVGDVTGADLVAGEESFLGAHVRALTLSLARKDEYTEEHTRRVALRAVQVGEELGLTGSRLRALATGALVHDIGKLSVPDSILLKPGPLTDEEFGIIKLHPEWGDKILVDLGFGDEVRHLVRDHHERLDGSGYPARVRRARSSPSTPGFSACATSMTRSSHAASTETPGRTSGHSRCSASRAGRRSTRNASQRSNAFSQPSANPSRPPSRPAEYHRATLRRRNRWEWESSGTGSWAATRPSVSRNSFEMTAGEQPEALEDFEAVKDDISRRAAFPRRRAA